MPTDGTFYAPVGYSAWWPLAGAAILVLCLGWCAWIWISTRAQPSADVPGFIAPRNAETVRRKYLMLISSIEQRHSTGALTGRAAHLELSLAVRTFVHEMTGVKAQRMTLKQLRDHQLPLVADAVEQFYPGEFAAYSEQPSVAASAQAAGSVVSSWR
ncbi:hypothetical protein SAMN04489740_0674 [Arthrobacter alpinus]|uniref:Uncharacterized protein n=1 Tax=Arthrobacter alpinus TaxID=656366 RepID=A0A1H5G4W6_9MICC|nr:hypothetical protein [Arthrobacter alpinus]SEE10776.1 hypothetical protein SAMN04489740_0674 [Arthrobacter alpinus]